MSAAPGWTIGLDMGGTKCLGVVLDPTGRVRATRQLPTRVGGEEVIGVFAGVADALIAEIDGFADFGGRSAIAGVGAGLPGLVDREGRLSAAPHLPGVHDLEVARLLEERLGLPVTADNDATCAAWAEWQMGAGVGADDLLTVTIGTGIGGAFVVNGEIARGAHGFAGEIGHMTVQIDGPACICGRRGCWELFASGNALGAMGRVSARQGGVPGVVELAGGASAVTGEHVTRAAAGGDADAIRLVEELGRGIALGLANLTLVLDPGLIVLGGGTLERIVDVLLVAVRESFASQFGRSNGRRVLPEIRAAALGPQAGAIGAALLASARSQTN